jgi:hypothetical protein
MSQKILVEELHNHRCENLEFYKANIVRLFSCEFNITGEKLRFVLSAGARQWVLGIKASRPEA